MMLPVLMSLTESRSGEMRIDFATFVSWVYVLASILISNFIYTKIHVMLLYAQSQLFQRVGVYVYSPPLQVVSLHQLG